MDHRWIIGESYVDCKKGLGTRRSRAPDTYIFLLTPRTPIDLYAYRASAVGQGSVTGDHKRGGKGAERF